MATSARNPGEQMMTNRKATAGKWINPPVSYVEPARRFCALCGRPIARRFFEVTVDGKTLPFCEPEHADLFQTYEPPQGPDIL